MDQWLEAAAAASLSGAVDHYGAGAQHNVQFYVRPTDGRVLVLPPRPRPTRAIRTSRRRQPRPAAIAGRARLAAAVLTATCGASRPGVHPEILPGGRPCSRRGCPARTSRAMWPS
ncbi:MAG: hypothetical protein R3F43_26950 [bacterium]